jgi:hypothetical protein
VSLFDFVFRRLIPLPGLQQRLRRRIQRTSDRLVQ